MAGSNNYLFEGDLEWQEALVLTFLLYMEKGNSVRGD